MKRRARFVSLIVLASALACGLFYSRYTSQRAREATLQWDLRAIQIAIDHYTLDKQQPPQSLQDLINGHYLREIPTDPFTGKKDWVPYFDNIVLNPAGQTARGITNVHSASGRVGGNGAYGY
jgi:general secretion pathway protein G